MCSKGGERVGAPAVLALNWTLRVRGCPACKGRGRARPEVLKPEPRRFAAVMLTATALGLLICTVWLLVTPVTTLPKLMVLGETVSADCTAVPDTLTLDISPCEWVRAITPLLAPMDFGVNFTVSGKLSPGTMRTGVMMPEVENPGALIEISETVTWAVPEFFNMVTAETVLPT